MRATTLISLLIIVGCADTIDVTPTIKSIASLKAISTPQRTIQIHDNTIIEGRVVANDIYREHYNRIIIEDESAGAEINIDLQNNHIEYIFASKVQIHCNGLWMSNNNGKISIGGAPTEDSALSAIKQNQLQLYIKKSAEPIITPIRTPISIKDISARHTMCYISLHDVEIINSTPKGLFCDIDPLSGLPQTTYHTLRDSDGYTIPLKVVGSCSYSRTPTPCGSIDIYVIIDHFDGQRVAVMSNFLLSEE